MATARSCLRLGKLFVCTRLQILGFHSEQEVAQDPGSDISLVLSNLQQVHSWIDDLDVTNEWLRPNPPSGLSLSMCTTAALCSNRCSSVLLRVL